MSFGQRTSSDFSSIDYKVRYIDVTRPDTLAYKLTAQYNTDLLKVRSIFRWITEHIAYRTAGRYKRLSPIKNTYFEVEEDTGALKPLNIRVAEQVLQKQTEILQSILDNMADGVVVADENEKLLIFNLRF